MFDSIRAEVVSTLCTYINKPQEKYKGRDRISTVLTPEEAMKVMELIVERAELGCSMVLCQVQDLIQEILLVAIAVNPLRTSPWADDRDSPHYRREDYTL